MAESNLREAALRLGAVLSETREMARYLEEKKTLDADDEAMRLIEKQASLQQAVRTRQSEGSISIADLEELNQLQEAVSSKVSKYLGAQQEAKGLLTAVNGEISRLCGFSFVSFARPSDCCG
jgi:cell fate (sporulation/competence/biofilm development) regulator YlbF (YheA/YmcA/DUF963 family)